MPKIKKEKNRVFLPTLIYLIIDAYTITDIVGKLLGIANRLYTIINAMDFFPINNKQFAREQKMMH